MNDREREQLKERLRALADAPLGLHIDTVEHWLVSGVTEPRHFFQHLPLLMERDSILYVEGTTIHPEAATFYLKYQSQNARPVACGTVFPAPDIYHLDFLPEVITGMLELIERRPVCELLTHVSGYRLGRMVFSFHDAFESYLQIAGNVPESIVGAFCRALDVSYSRELMEKHANPYRDLLNVFEHPEKIKIPRVPWWRHIIDEFLAGWRKG